jgi:pimeloyl-ACP methyl ester carboxylesterase
MYRFLTGDGLELQGFLVEPAGRRSAAAVVHVHGWDGNFYENRFIDRAADACSRLGFSFFSFNNRGHDYVADLLRPASFDYLQLGGIYEKLADGRADIAAALAFLRSRGLSRFVLQGHSHGATKVVHYLTMTRDPRVCGSILLSPSDDLGWARVKLGQRFLWVLARSRELVRAGKGRQLLPERDFPYPVSAATFLDCFNKGSITGSFNVSRTDREGFPELASLQVPVLLAVGTVEEAFVGSPRKYVGSIRACMVNCPSFTGAVIKGAPHNYLGHEAELAGVLAKWLAARKREWTSGVPAPYVPDSGFRSSGFPRRSAG